MEKFVDYSGTIARLSTAELSVGYGKNVLIPDITFDVKAGEILVLIGPNGSGKSTILKTLSRQLERMGGSVKLAVVKSAEELSGRKSADIRKESSRIKDNFQMQDISAMKEDEIAKKMAVLLTDRPGAELMTVEDMVSTGRYPYTGRLGILSAKDKEAVANAIDLVALEPWKDCLFEEISDGQKQRAMLARAICQEPEILILDEPTSFLDMHHKLELLSILKMLAREKHLAVILSLHELDLAQKIADHLLCVTGGKIDRYGKPEEIFGAEKSEKTYIETLYGVTKGTFIPEFGSLELEKVVGKPKVFVIGGGGSGIPVYRRLQREGIPFAAGVLAENDLEYPVAKALAVEVVSCPAFCPVGGEEIARAKKLIEECEDVICTVENWGPMNEKNHTLLDFQQVLEKQQRVQKSTSGWTPRAATQTP